MRINQAGRELIKSFEGLSLNAYLCPAKVWTIGWGHTGNDVYKGVQITRAQAETLLERDLLPVERGVLVLLQEAPTTENQFSAMVSLAYNIGRAAFSRSTVLKKHLEGDHEAAAAAFSMWVKGGGKVLPGLVRRRDAEAQLYRTP